MKNLLKISLVILTGMMYMTTHAQSLMIKGGANFSNLNGDKPFESFGATQMKPGLHIGIVADFPVNDLLSIESGLLLSHRGFQIQESGTYDFFGQQIPYSVDLKYSAYYLNLPLTAKVRFPLNRNTDFYLQGGGFVGCGLFGKGEFTMVDDGQKQSDNAKEDWENTRRIDAGLSLGTGVEVNRLLLGVSYDMGLVPVFDDGGNYGNLNLSVGYTLFSRN